MRRFLVLTLGCLLLSGCGGGGGGNNDSAANANTFPLTFSMAPTQGPVAGGTVVVITGRNFTKRNNNNTVHVEVGGASVPCTVNSDTQITFTSPSGVQFVTVGNPETQVAVQVGADSKISSGLTGSTDLQFIYKQ